MKLIDFFHLDVIASDRRERSNLFIFFSFIVGCSSCQSEPAQDMVCFQKQCVEVEVAQKPEELTRGLQFREKLAPNAGMLFVFPNSQMYSFWMKDTKIPLDMIWMDFARRIVYIKKNVPPCVADPCQVYTPDQEAMYVLEINGGTTDTLGIQIGDTAVFQLNRGAIFLEKSVISSKSSVINENIW